MKSASLLPVSDTVKPAVVTFGVCATGDPRIDQESRAIAWSISSAHRQ